MDELCVIMNPPYDGNLHLKILNKVVEKFPESEIVNLSPIRWLQDPLAEYKKNSDFKKFEDVRKKIEDLEEIKAENAQKMFNANMYENLGIYHITSNGGANIKPMPVISQALFDKVNLPTYQGKYKSIYDVFKEGRCDFSRPFVKFSPLQGGVNHTSWYNIMSPQKELAFTDKVVKGRGTAIGTVNFDTQEEAENFFAYCQTKFVRACNGNVKTNIRWPGYAIPFMSTYEHEWTDEMLYKYFDLTEDEIKVIEEEIKIIEITN